MSKQRRISMIHDIDGSDKPEKSKEFNVHSYLNFELPFTAGSLSEAFIAVVQHAAKIRQHEILELNRVEKELYSIRQEIQRKEALTNAQFADVHAQLETSWQKLLNLEAQIKNMQIEAQINNEIIAAAQASYEARIQNLEKKSATLNSSFTSKI